VAEAVAAKRDTNCFAERKAIWYGHEIDILKPTTARALVVVGIWSKDRTLGELRVADI
jgi:hypothetical protein